MSKAVLISIQPRWCELIASGKKTVEARKTKPNLETPFKCYIYQIKKGKVGTGLFTCDGEIMGRSVKNGTVIGEFECDGFDEFTPTDHGVKFRRFTSLSETCLSVTELRDYLNGQPGYGWRISNLVIYDTPKLLSEFTGLRETKFGFAPVPITRAPQSWCYVEDLGGADHE